MRQIAYGIVIQVGPNREEAMFQTSYDSGRPVTVHDVTPHPLLA